jgi:hypothetical protein
MQLVRLFICHKNKLLKVKKKRKKRKKLQLHLVKVMKVIQNLRVEKPSTQLEVI